MASFQISATTATFGAMIRGASQTAGDLQQLEVGVNLRLDSDWVTMHSMVTSKLHVHVPVGGTPVIDVVRGLGEGTLTISGLGAVTAILTHLQRNTFVRGGRTLGQATFLITGTWA